MTHADTPRHDENDKITALFDENNAAIMQQAKQLAMKQFTAKFGNYCAHGSPEDKALLLVQMLPLHDATKNTFVNWDLPSSLKSDDANSCF